MKDIDTQYRLRLARRERTRANSPNSSPRLPAGLGFCWLETGLCGLVITLAFSHLLYVCSFAV